MKTIIRNIIFGFIGLLLFNTGLKAQSQLKLADKQFELFNYIKAIDLYEQSYRKNETLYAAERLAKAYSLINDYQQAESWYAIVSKFPDSKPESLLSYAKVLQNNAKYSEAKNMYLKYIGLAKDISPGQQKNWIASCDSALKWMKNPEKLEIVNQKDLNTSQSDWAAVSYDDGIVFTSDRNTKVVNQKKRRPFLRFDGTVLPDKRVYGWTGNGYLKLYFKSGKVNEIIKFPVQAGTDYHIGSASFTADGNTMFFTLTQIPGKIRKVKKQPSTINVELYSSTKGANGIWGKPIAFPYNNSAKYSVGDPFVTADGKQLYFSSNMPGGVGGSDIYLSIQDKEGGWGTPINLRSVNTEGNERSPVVGLNSDFYFSSDGYIGMGGLDVYKGNLINETVERIENLKYPFNSPQDDFGFSLGHNGAITFLSSNRTEGFGQDDIYRIKQAPVINLRLKGKVINKNTNLPMANVLVVLSKTNGGVLKVETDATGNFDFNLSKESEYALAGVKRGFLADVKDVNTLGIVTSTVIEKDLYLGVIELNKAIRIDNIYYDFDKWNIRPDAAEELDKLVKTLNENPTIWIELGSHTDSRGKDAYNLNLSQKRAESAVQYIISKGIDKNRITARGYGETQLVNRCANGIECTVEEHQQNRRTEFKIVKF
jgi:peptidoglycan-associated lipoprotein